MLQMVGGIEWKLPGSFIALASRSSLNNALGERADSDAGDCGRHSNAVLLIRY